MADEDGRGVRSAAWGVLAVVFASGAFGTWPVAVAASSTFPLWPIYVFAGVAVLAAYLCFATAWGWWPTSRSVGEPGVVRLEPSAASSDADTEEAAVQASPAVGGSATAVPVNLPSPPVQIRLMPELDVATNRLRLGALNRGALGSFRAEVVDASDQDGNRVDPADWPIPWLDDGSLDAKEIAMFDKPLLDFAHFDLRCLKEDMESGTWANGDHWVFPSLPQPVKVGCSPIGQWSGLERQHFVITVRVTRSDPPGYVDTQFKIGLEGTRPYCRELPERTTAGTAVPTDPQQLLDLATRGGLGSRRTAAEPEPVPATPTPAFTGRWRHTSDGGKVPSLMRLTHTSVSHPAYMSWQPNETPPSVKVGLIVGCQPIDPTRSGTELRAKFLAFLNSPDVRALVESLTDVEPDMSWKNLAGNGPRTLEAALTAGADPMEGVPAASALLLLPTPGEALYGRDERSATLMLYIEPRTADGQVPPASDLTTWYRRFSLALAVPRAFANFLTGELGLATSNDPPVQLGVWLQSYQPLTVMVDIDGLRVLPGRSTSNQFIGWTLAAPDGKSAAGTARDLLVDLCEYKLNLDDFEQALPGESL